MMKIPIKDLIPLNNLTEQDNLILYDTDSDKEYKTERVSIGTIVSGTAYFLNPQEYTYYEGASATKPSLAVNKLNAYKLDDNDDVYLELPLASIVEEGSATFLFYSKNSYSSMYIDTNYDSDDVLYYNGNSYNSLNVPKGVCFLLIAIPEGYWVLSLG